jgi:hypothetical protein
MSRQATGTSTQVPRSRVAAQTPGGSSQSSSAGQGSVASHETADGVGCGDGVSVSAAVGVLATGSVCVAVAGAGTGVSVGAGGVGVSVLRGIAVGVTVATKLVTSSPQAAIAATDQAASSTERQLIRLGALYELEPWEKRDTSIFV